MSIRKVDKEEFERLYNVEQMGINQIAKHLNSDPSSVYQKMKRLQIQFRQPHVVYLKGNKRGITKEFLQHEYEELGKPTTQIAREIGCNDSTIWHLMVKFDIKRRHCASYRKGKKFSPEWREALSAARIKAKLSRGIDNPNWKGGVTVANYVNRISNDYQVWRRRVLRFKGESCSSCGKNLLIPCECCGHCPDRHVHHIQPFSDNPDLRLSIDNAVVLCESCHKRQHGKGH
jgi:5-methylcytosine-specific restriction endonuclease McrA